MKTAARLLILSSLMFGTSVWADTKVSAYGFAAIDYLTSNREFDADHKPISVLSTYGKSEREHDLMKTTRSQFVVKHSRFGMNVDNSLGLKFKLEFDLDGEAGNTTGVTTSSTGIIRVRQAHVCYVVNENDTLTVGKKWDIFSPLNPHTNQVTSIQLWAGNTGFLSDGAEYVHKAGAATIAGELKNIGSDSATIKLSGPAATVRADYKMGSQLLGISVLNGHLAYKRQDTTAPYSDKDRPIEGYNFYYNGKFFEEKLDLIGEYYAGRNLGAATIGALAQAPKTQASTSLRGYEAGYYVSAKYKLEGYAVYGGYGANEFFNDPMAASNSKNGLSSNALARLGYERTVMENVTVYTELANVNSGYFEAGRVAHYSGNYLDIGLIAKF